MTLSFKYPLFSIKTNSINIECPIRTTNINLDENPPKSILAKIGSWELTTIYLCWYTNLKYIYCIYKIHLYIKFLKRLGCFKIRCAIVLPVFSHHSFILMYLYYWWMDMSFKWSWLLFCMLCASFLPLFLVLQENWSRPQHLLSEIKHNKYI